jgi:hypothetical protein
LARGGRFVQLARMLILAVAVTVALIAVDVHELINRRRHS